MKQSCKVLNYPLAKLPGQWNAPKRPEATAGAPQQEAVPAPKRGHEQRSREWKAGEGVQVQQVWKHGAHHHPVQVQLRSYLRLRQR